MTVTPELVTETISEAQRALAPVADADWSVPAKDLDWSCWDTGVHLADDLFSYASQILAQPTEGYLPIEVKVLDEATPAELLRSTAMCAGLLRSAATSASPEVRAWHPYGTSDAGGFVAMGVVEALVHVHDIAGGLGVDWTPSSHLCSPVLARLFPDAPQGDPWQVLLWCTGRAPLGDRPRKEKWRWDSTVRA